VAPLIDTSICEAGASSIVVQNSTFTGVGRGVKASGPKPNASVPNNTFEGQQGSAVEGKFTEFSDNRLLTCANDCVNFSAQCGSTVVRGNHITVDPNHPDQPGG
jgi:hypothetical protein